MTPKDEQMLYAIWLRENQSAIDLINMLGHISQVWDDLFDGDIEGDDEQVSRMMERALTELPRNKFYVEHVDTLAPIIFHEIARWHEANDIERLEDNEQLLHVSYIIRSSLTNIVIAMTYLIGGRHWGRQAALAIRRAVFDEPYDEYLQEHTHVRRRRRTGTESRGR